MSEAGQDNVDAPEGHLDSLAPKMLQAMDLRREGKDDEAVEILTEVLRAEPRLAEARLELCHIAATNGDWEEAEGQGRFAVETLRGGGQWTLDLESEELLSFALNLLGEVIVRCLEEGDLLMDDRPAFVARWNEASEFFRESLERDNSNRDARTNCVHYRPMAEDQSSSGDLASDTSTASTTE
jgi:tetratricopeptide (TPR) repeat protein